MVTIVSGPADNRRDRRLRRSRLQAAAVFWLLIPGAVISAGLLVDRLGGLARPAATWPLTLLAVGLLLAGVVFIQLATRDLAVHGGGTPNPREPARRLVTEGAFALCRHPMFFGYDLAAIGVALLLRSPGMLLVAYPVFIGLQIRYLRREEERVLRRRFGAAFESYRQRVPFLVPRPWRRKP